MTPDDAASYVPALSPDEVERIRRWHERAYAVVATRGEQAFEYLGLTLVVPPEVQPIMPTSHLLGEAVLTEAGQGERVLDMGTGCGVNAILAATRGARVVAVDVNPRAIEAARANAERNGVAGRVEVRSSDVFSAVGEAFDLIVFDPPFRWFKPRDLADTAITDEGYRAMTTFFRHARRHLAPGGRMLIFFGTSGDMGYLKRLMAEEGFSWAEAARLAGERDGIPVEYVTFRVT
jgi:release factor glutamine methyltransferase